ncbi:MULTISPECIES: transporter substrate-binding domain-containing protein [Thiorhodovibrio]|uniref:transporter substrate-binding domain-containing protein n=1 Tax=Thiorhodovibrio TaxID=61593 RepID=UPI001913FD51|nr:MULTISPECIES: transporter substrate-binding domain-containing protein [Thiorhodovibrio]MBK5967591.1 ABC transporter substrate-binding protein [Thiorhodovibrio winogradskyi]WPL14941.1 Glutamine-binding periplasmic protein precursor [Thiorhodovibrio litoralis]
MTSYRLLSLPVFLACWLAVSVAAGAADLPEIKARGELRHLGIPYANFVTGAGDGFDVDMTRGFAEFLGVDYKLVYSDFYSVMRDLLGKKVVRSGDTVTLEGDFPIKGDMIATGFTVLPWREQVLLYSEPTFPSQVMLIARADSPIQPIKGSDNLLQDIEETKALIGQQSLLVMEKTCLDPANYGLDGVGIELHVYTKSSNINEMVPALLKLDADLSLLDVPDLMLDMQKWAGTFKVIGPISQEQALAAAFPKDAPQLRDAYDAYLRQIKADGTYDRLVQKYYPGVQRYFPAFFAKQD